MLKMGQREAEKRERSECLEWLNAERGSSLDQEIECIAFKRMRPLSGQK
jgi:hypothetical protein